LKTKQEDALEGLTGDKLTAQNTRISKTAGQLAGAQGNYMQYQTKIGEEISKYEEFQGRYETAQTEFEDIKFMWEDIQLQEQEKVKMEISDRFYNAMDW